MATLILQSFRNTSACSRNGIQFRYRLIATRTSTYNKNRYEINDKYCNATGGNNNNDNYCNDGNNFKIRLYHNQQQQNQQQQQQRRNLSSTNNQSIESSSNLPFSTLSLGLEYRFIKPVLHSIRQLPEVESALSTFPSGEAQDNLKRAVNVFQSFGPGSKEHLAGCALLAECQQRLAQHDKAIKSLQELISSFEQNDDVFARDDLILAKSKIEFYMGNFDKSQEACEMILSQYDDLNEYFPTTNLHVASAMTGKALSQLANMNTKMDAYSVRDFFRVAINFLDRHPPQLSTTTKTSLPVAVAHLNAGIAEVGYGYFLHQQQQRNKDAEESSSPLSSVSPPSIPMTAALRTWFQGLQQIDDVTANENAASNHVKSSNLVKARLQSNIAIIVLNHEKDQSDYLSMASDYAGKALKLYDNTTSSSSNNNNNEHHHEGLCRVLSVAAACYHAADSAVTAEGLYQSAISQGGGRRNGLQNKQVKSDKYQHPMDVLFKIDLMDAYRGYSKLCSEWEKRSSDATKLEKEALDMDSTLVAKWQKKPAVYGSLWFWTPGDFISN